MFKKQLSLTDLRPSLAESQPTQKLWVQGYRDHGRVQHLIGMGLARGAAIEVLQNVAGNFVVRFGDTRLAINADLAQNILVTDQPLSALKPILGESQTMEQPPSSTLRDLNLHQTGQVAGFAPTDDPTLRAYKKKLLAMGLTPGAEFTVTHIAPLGDPVEIQVRGFKLSLRKAEAASLLVKEIRG